MSWAIRAILALAVLATAVVVPRAVAEQDGVTARMVQSGSDEACGQLQVDGDQASGGCDLEVDESRIDLTALTVFGDRTLALCNLGFRMNVGGNGDVVMSQLTLATAMGVIEHSICGDILPCRKNLKETENIAKLPWRGRLEAADGSIHADVQACFDTCFGRFEGEVRFAVKTTARGLRLRVDRSRLGTSGLEISGSWDTRPFYGGRLQLDY